MDVAIVLAVLAAVAGFVIWLLDVQSNIYEMREESRLDISEMQEKAEHRHDLYQLHYGVLCRWVKDDFHRRAEHLRCDLPDR